MQATQDKLHKRKGYQLRQGTFSQASATRLGVLLLHGFTSSLDCVNGLLPYLKNEGIDYEMPLMRGHGTSPQDLAKYGSPAWFQDAAMGLYKLGERVDRVVIVGLSMGGLLALKLAIEAPSYREKIVGLVTWAAALKFRNKLSALVGPLSRFFTMWPAQDSFTDPVCRLRSTNYKEFPTKSFASLYELSKVCYKQLEDIEVPICIIHSKRDQIIDFNSAEALFRRVNSPYRELNALMESGHELGQDSESKEVFEITMRFIHKFIV